MKSKADKSKADYSEFCASVRAYINVSEEDMSAHDGRDQMCRHLVEIPAAALLQMETHDLAAIVSVAVGVLPDGSAQQVVLDRHNFFSVRAGHPIRQALESLVASPPGLAMLKKVHTLLRRGLQDEEIRPFLFAGSN